MKAIICDLLCALLCCALLAGCGGRQDGETEAAGAPAAAPAGESGSEAHSRYTLLFQGTEIAVNTPMAPLAEKLGEPTSYFEARSCVYDGLDKEYTYGGVIIRTYPAGGQDYILSVELRDDTVSTREGIYVGAGRADVTAAYGEPGDETAAALRYTDGDCTLVFTMEDDRVSGITYTSGVV